MLSSYVTKIPDDIAERITRLRDEQQLSAFEISKLFGVALQTIKRVHEQQPIQMRVIRRMRERFPEVDQALAGAKTNASPISVETALRVLTELGYEIVIRKRDNGTPKSKV